MKIKTTSDLIAAVTPLVAGHDAANFGSGERSLAYRTIRNRFENIDLARALIEQAVRATAAESSLSEMTKRVEKIGEIAGMPFAAGPGEAREIWRKRATPPAAQALPSPAGMSDSIGMAGNHLAAFLVHHVGADFAERFHYHADHYSVLETIQPRYCFDVWSAWASIMRERERLTAKPEGST